MLLPIWNTLHRLPEKILSVEKMVEVLIIVGAYALITRVNRALKMDDDAEILDLGEMQKKSVN